MPNFYDCDRVNNNNTNLLHLVAEALELIDVVFLQLDQFVLHSSDHLLSRIHARILWA